MKKSEILPNLNGMVMHDGIKYKLTAGIVRRKDNGEVDYSVELQSLRAKSSVVIAGLDRVELLEGGDER